MVSEKRELEGVKVMGSERKSKEEKKKRRRSPSYDSDAEGKGKRVRTVEDRKSKSSKVDEKDKSKKKKSKSHKSSKHHSDKEKKLKEKRRKDKGHEHDRHSKLKFQELSKDDYYSRNNEFATWLKEEKNIFFSDLTSDSAQDSFSQFIEDWNDKKLESRYYEGIATGPRTAHNWNIKQ